MRSVIHSIGSTRFNLVILLIILITAIILPGKLWSIPQDIKVSSLQDSNNLLKPSYIDIKSELTTNKDKVLPNQEIEYTFGFKNIGTEEPESLIIKFYAPNEMLSDPFHGNFTRIKLPTDQHPKVHYESIDPQDPSELLRTITWRVAKLALDDSLWIKFTLIVDDLKESKTLIAFMTISCEIPEPFFNTNSADVNVILLPDLTISKSVSAPGPYNPGDEGIYTLTYRNNGSRAIDLVYVTDHLPLGIIIIDLEPEPFSMQNNTYTWLFENLDAGDFGIITIHFKVDPNIEVKDPFSEIDNFVEIESGTYYFSAEISFKVKVVNELVLDKNVYRNGENVGITVFIGQENQVKIDVFNVAGEHIKNLEDRFYQKDPETTITSKSLSWNCQDKDGRMVGSGVYVIVMEAGRYKTWKKCIVVK